MSVTSTTVAREFASSSLRARPAVLNAAVLIQVTIAVFPAMVFVALSKPALGAVYVTVSAFGLMIFNALRSNRYEFLSITIGCVPVIVLLRGFAFYHGITTLLTIEIILWCFVGANEVRTVWKDPVWRCLLLLCVMYWWASFINTGDYYSNSRALDFGLTATIVYLLAHSRTYLATAFVGIAISTTCLALGMLPLGGERLGMAQIDGVELGNPVLLGVPAAFVVLLCFAENGRWLLVEDKPIYRTIICLVSGEWLILSGSRGSWTVTIVGMLLILLFGKQNRKPLLITLGVICLASIIVLSTDLGSKITYQYDRSVDGERSLANRTSGRSLQWGALPEVFAKSPVWGWGAGSGREVVRLYTGHNLEWHALYLQVLGETGLLGFIPLIALLGIFIRRSIQHLRRFGEIAPLLGVASFLSLGLSVQGLDAFSGILLGLVFVPYGPIRRYVLGQRMIAVVEDSEISSATLSR